MILFKDVLKIPESEYSNIKVKLNKFNSYDDPIELFKTSPDLVNNNWLFWRGKKQIKNGYFSVGQIAVCLVRMPNNSDLWLLTTIKRVTKELNVLDGVSYEGEEFEEYKDLYGRLILKYHNKAQNICRRFDAICNNLEVHELLPEIFDDDSFPGYDSVKLSYSKLKRIIEGKKPDWDAALRSQKAVYLITDISNGKLYVGKASSNNGMLLKRWSDYVANGHGGDVELKALVKEKGFDYVKKNFQYGKCSVFA